MFLVEYKESAFQKYRPALRYEEHGMLSQGFVLYSVKTTLALPTKKLGCHETETNISSAYEN